MWHRLPIKCSSVYEPWPSLTLLQPIGCNSVFPPHSMLYYAISSSLTPLGIIPVEPRDHEIYKKVALSKGEAFINLYDLGKMQNLKLLGKEDNDYGLKGKASEHIAESEGERS
ncbi:hypothetical protein K435DRAFT_811914 [Dendrothele bispora CBS 962.96]|uniref:Uncharacterized protein n=1 Tax=Dendrothele bispora (strain CBS 962.96) TaxID=1314807 RepID=A0A4S8KQN2_DENBC|nr:hypothetical protein K435DRAFT_811914 [Dendrothele bispora CBS 962.96]